MTRPIVMCKVLAVLQGLLTLAVEGTGGHSHLLPWNQWAVRFALAAERRGGCVCHWSGGGPAA